MNNIDAALNVSQLSFSYGTHKALDDVSMTVPPGRFVGLLGANGAGKSTLFSILTGLYSASAGTVAVDGHDIRQNTLAALAAMGVVFQRTTLDMDLSVIQNLRYAASLHGLGKQLSTDRIEQGIEQHGLTGLEKRRVAALSGGQRRRVELARAWLHEPAILLLDEPTVGLDYQSRRSFIEHVKTLCADQGVSVLCATHLMDEVSNDDAVYILDKGRIVGQGEVSDLLKEHAMPDVSELFGHLISREPS